MLLAMDKTRVLKAPTYLPTLRKCPTFMGKTEEFHEISRKLEILFKQTPNNPQVHHPGPEKLEAFQTTYNYRRLQKTAIKNTLFNII
jgi:hypothetical protein